MKHWNFQNFKDAPVSTGIGILLIGFSVYVYLKVPGSEVFALALLGAGLLASGLKDPKLNP